MKITALLAFVLAVPGLRAADTPAADTPATLRLATVRAELEAADKSLAGATLSTHGGYIEKGRADIARALTGVRVALDFVGTNSVAAALPVPPARGGISDPNLTFVRAPSAPTQPNMYGALPRLQAALLALEAAPGGDLGGQREPITAAIATAAAEVVTGIKFADGNRATNQRGNPFASAPGPSGSSDAMSARMQSKIAAAEARDRETARLVFADSAPVTETSRQRLMALETKVRAVLADVTTAANSPGGEFAAPTRRALQDTLAEIAAGLRFLDTNPKADTLPDDSLQVALPNADPPPGMGVLNGNRSKSYPTVGPATNAMLAGLRNFLNGTPPDKQRGPLYGNPSGGGPVIGPLDGHRDRIIRLLGNAMHGLMEATIALDRPAIPAPMVSAAPTGSISGVVLDSAGDPVGNVLISFARRKSPEELRAAAILSYTPSPPGAPAARGFQANVDRMTSEQRQAVIKTAANEVRYANAQPATLSDSQGRFVIEGAPPDLYSISGSLVGARGEWTLSGAYPENEFSPNSKTPSVEVSSGTETRLSSPLNLGSF